MHRCFSVIQAVLRIVPEEGKAPEKNEVTHRLSAVSGLSTKRHRRNRTGPALAGFSRGSALQSQKYDRR